MNNNVIRYQFIIRLLGVGAIVFLIGYSEYKQHLLLLFLLISIYVCINVIARLRIGVFKENRFHIYNLFFDVTMLSVGIAVRGGLRSDFYLGYFLILGYVLLVKEKRLLVNLSMWIVVNYTFFAIFFTDETLFSYGRLMIRLTLLVGTMMLLYNYSKMLVDSETLREKAVNMAMFDTLTGLYNRRILEYLEQLLPSQNISLYVILIDLDNFKEINDQYGHGKGDEVLVAFSSILQKSLQKDDLAIRFGGEEFLMIIQTSDYSYVHSKISQMQQSLLNRRFEWLNYDRNITFTAGISLRQQNEDIEDTIERADIALYHGKNKGKNAIVLQEQMLNK